MAGFYKMHRGWLKHPVLSGPFCRAAAWAWLIDEAAWKPMRKMVAGQMRDLDRGQLSHSLRFIAEAWGWKKDAVARFIARLETETMIQTETATGQLVITICNYDTYQARDEDTETDSETDTATPTRQQRDSSATNYKNIKKSRTIDSVPNGTDAGASDLFGNQGEEGAPKPKSMKAMLWGQAKVILAEANVTNGHAASFLGKLARDYGDDIFLPALVAMDREKPGDPVAWLTAACQSRSEGAAGKSAMPEGFVMSQAFSAHSRRLLPSANPKEMFAAFKADAKARGLRFADWDEAAMAFVSNRALPRGAAR